MAIRTRIAVLLAAAPNALRTTWILGLLGVLALACAAPPGADLEANKALVRAFTDATNDADWDRLAGLMADDFTRHSAATTGPQVRSSEEFIELQKGFLASFPDQHVRIDEILAEGDLVAIRAVYSGTQTGPMGDLPATGKRAESPFLGILRIESGRVAELWVEWDNLALLTQLGLFPPPGG